jgi:hypothetical protein
VVGDNCGVSSTAYTTISGTVTPSSGSSLAGAVLEAGDNVIEWKVTDVSGLMTTCQFTVRVNPCIQITGKLLWMGDAASGVKLANVALTGAASDTYGPTDASGGYSLIANVGGNFTISPTKNVNMFNGVTVADATAIQQHLVGIAPITDFYRLVAADVNKSSTISTIDAAIIRQGLLGNPFALAILNTTKSWRFISTGYSPPAVVGPYTLPVFSETRTPTGVTSDLPGQDFFGVKTGDVLEEGFPGPGPGIADPTMKPASGVEPLRWLVQDRELKAGEPVEVVFTATNFTALAAYQFALNFDAAQLQFDTVEALATALPLSAADNFGLYSVAQGEIRTLWTAVDGHTLLADTPVFRLRFTALASGRLLSEVLGLDTKTLVEVAYTADLVQVPVQLRYLEVPITTGTGQQDQQRVQLLQNRPNPFTDRTTIGFVLPKACAAQLRVFDSAGRDVFRLDKNYPAGYSEETIRLDGAAASGMLYYELTTPFGSAVRQMSKVGK